MSTSPTPAPGSHAARVAAYYDANTQEFYLDRWHPEDVHFGLFPEGASPVNHFSAVKRMTRCLVAPAAIGSRERVVDAGCGIGGAALDIARATGAEVLGLTVSAVQVDLAKRRARAAGLGDRVRFEQADCSTALPCGDASVDVVVTIEAVCHFEDKAAFLRECRRVLKPGGRLAGSDWMSAEATSAADYAEYLQPVCDAWRLAGMATPSQWQAMLASAGFEVRECVDFDAAVLPNARILSRACLDLMLEVANGCHPVERARLWQSQYDSLTRAWFERRFTIGRFFALAA